MYQISNVHKTETTGNKNTLGVRDNNSYHPVHERATIYF